MIKGSPDRKKSEELLEKYIESDSLRQHCRMVATAMEAHAKMLEKSEDEIHEWWTAGLLHDLDWEKYPEEHPKKAVSEILPPLHYSPDVLSAIEAHAPERTGEEPESEIERYLFACDEISGFMNAVALMRPNGFSDMKIKSVKKKLKDKSFAANVPREDIEKGAKLIDRELSEHIQFMITIFRNLKK